MKQIKNLTSLLLIATVLFFASCDKKTNQFSQLTIKGMTPDQILQLYDNGDSATRMKIITLYTDSLENSPPTEDKVKKSMDLLYAFYYADNSKPWQDNLVLKKFGKYLTENYNLYFNKLDFDQKYRYIMDHSECIKFKYSDVSSLIDEIENKIKEARYIRDLPDGRELVSLMAKSDGAIFPDSVRLEKDRLMGSNLIMKTLMPKLKKVSNLTELDIFYDLNDFCFDCGFFYKEISQEYNGKEAVLLKKLEIQPQSCSYSDILIYFRKKGKEVYMYNNALLSEVVKKAKTYDQCVDLMRNYIPENSPIWRACDRKAQMLIGL